MLCWDCLLGSLIVSRVKLFYYCRQYLMSNQTALWKRQNWISFTHICSSKKSHCLRVWLHPSVLDPYQVQQSRNINRRDPQPYIRTNKEHVNDHFIFILTKSASIEPKSIPSLYIQTIITLRQSNNNRNWKNIWVHIQASCPRPPQRSVGLFAQLRNKICGNP